jgi:hypothetical protein
MTLTIKKNQVIFAFFCGEVWRCIEFLHPTDTLTQINSNQPVLPNYSLIIQFLYFNFNVNKKDVKLEQLIFIFRFQIRLERWCITNISFILVFFISKVKPNLLQFIIDRSLHWMLFRASQCAPPKSANQLFKRMIKQHT